MTCVRFVLLSPVCFVLPSYFYPQTLNLHEKRGTLEQKKKTAFLKN